MRILLTVFFSCALPLPAIAGKHRFERQLMGTRFTIVCHASDQNAARKAAESAFSIATEMNSIASDYLPTGELSQLTKKPVGIPIRISSTLYQLLDHSRQLAEITHGAFDPALGPLTVLWRETRDHGRLPDPVKLLSARASSGWRHFTLDPASRDITLRRENMAFDLGGVAKGYAADLMLESLVTAGIPMAMIAAGGDIRLGDPPPDRDGWRVALQTFDPARADEMLVLSNAAVSTSGDLHQSVEIDGIRYSHILDPATGLGLTRRLAATVIADEAKFSDPLATAACVLGPDAREAMEKLPGVRQVKIHTLQEPSPNQRYAPSSNEPQP
jgi:FAD:protein FMN transferase